MSADFSEVSKFSAGKNFKSLEFASGVPLLEVELDELQDIQNYRRELFIKTFISNGFVTKNDMSLVSSTLTVPSDILVINGEIFEVLEDMVITVESGDTVYLAFSVENVMHSDILKNSGNLSGGTEITNDIQDPRSTEETSRRNQIQVQLTKVNTDPAKVYLTVATITGASTFADNRVTVSLINTNTNASTVLVEDSSARFVGENVETVLAEICDEKAPLHYDLVDIVASETLPLNRANKRLKINSASAVTITVPLNSSVAFTVGDEIELIQYGAGSVSVAATSGVTIRSKNSRLTIGGQYSSATLLKIGTDEWLLVGSLV